MDCFIPLTDLVAGSAFEGRSDGARERRAERWAREELSKDLREKRGNAYYISQAARLLSGQTIESFLKCGARPETLAGHRLPPDSKNWREKDYKRFFDAWHLLDLWDEFCAANPGIPEDKLIYLFKAEHGAWCKSVGLQCHLRRIQEYRRRCDPQSNRFDGNVDSRGRPRGGAKEPAPELWKDFLSLRLNGNKFSIRAASNYARGEAKRRGLYWPSDSTIRLLYRKRIIKPAEVLAREGNRRYEADCAPKIRRSYEDIEVNDWCSLDGRRFDIMAKHRNARGEWIRKRVVVIALVDAKSRAIMGWAICLEETSDGVCACLKMAVREGGVPANLIIDQGKPFRYLRIAASAQGKLFERVTSALTALGSVVHPAIPYAPWSKQIESIWNLVKNGFDRWFPSFWGGSPAERPAAADKWTREHINKLPTIDDLKKAFEIYHKIYMSTPQYGEGIDGLTPKLVIEQSPYVKREIDPKILDFYFNRKVKARVGARGVRHNGIYYGQMDSRLFKLQGREVFLSIDPEDASCVVVCDLEGRPICKVTNRRLTGCSQEEIREVFRRRGRLKKLAKSYLPERKLLLETPTETLLRTRYEHARVAEAEQRESLPPPKQKQSIRVIRPDLSEALKRIEPTEPEQAPAEEHRMTLEELGDLLGGETPPETPAMDLADLYDLADEQDSKEKDKEAAENDHLPDWWRRTTAASAG